MQFAGFDTTSLKVMRAPGIHFDFFLENRISASKYSREWKIYYPSTLR